MQGSLVEFVREVTTPAFHNFVKPETCEKVIRFAIHPLTRNVITDDDSADIIGDLSDFFIQSGLVREGMEPPYWSYPFGPFTGGVFYLHEDGTLTVRQDIYGK